MAGLQHWWCVSRVVARRARSVLPQSGKPSDGGGLFCEGRFLRSRQAAAMVRQEAREAQTPPHLRSPPRPKPPPPPHVDREPKKQKGPTPRHLLAKLLRQPPPPRPNRKSPRLNPSHAN